MKKLLVGLAALPFLAGAAMASQPTLLSDAAMDQVTAGYTFTYQFVPPATAANTGPCTASCIGFSNPSDDGILGANGFPSLKVK